MATLGYRVYLVSGVPKLNFIKTLKNKLYDMITFFFKATKYILQDRGCCPLRSFPLFDFKYDSVTIRMYIIYYYYNGRGRMCSSSSIRGDWRKG